ncbi:M1 family metallopeptidase [Paenibacillus tarimensis]
MGTIRAFIWLLLLSGLSIIVVLFTLSNEDSTNKIEPVAAEKSFDDKPPVTKPDEASVGLYFDQPVIEQSDSMDKEVPVREPQYRMDIEFHPEERLLTGKTEVEVWNMHTEPVKDIKFHLHLNAFNKGARRPVLDSFVSRTYPHGVRYGGIKVGSVVEEDRELPFQVEGTVLTVQLDTVWEPETKRVISLEWEADIPGIHHRVGTDGGNFWFGNTVPVLAVYDNEWRTNDYEPVGDPFNTVISNFLVHIATPEEYRIVATGTQAESIENGRRLTNVEAYRVRDFSFAATKDTKLASVTTSSGVQLNLYYRKLSDALAKQALKDAEQFLAHMEGELTGYPYRELDIFENEMFITGMEYPGMVYVDSDRLKHPKGIQTLLHEIAHQWFYNLIGNDQINEPWLDEGFATFYTDRYLQQQDILSAVSPQTLDKERKNKKVSIAGVQNYSIWNSYWKSAYQRASYMIFDLERTMGTETFKEMMQAYAGQYAYQIATSADLRAIVQRYADEDMASFWQDWFN